MKRMRKLSSLLFSASLALSISMLSAADISGKWKGVFETIGPDGEPRDAGALMHLKQTGTEITGTAGPNEQSQWTIERGKIDGGRISFEVQTDSAVMRFDLSLVEDHMTGEASAEHDGKCLKARVDVTKAE